MSARPPGIPNDAWEGYAAILGRLCKLWPSVEQWEVIMALREKCHVLVNSVAGSGKTTTGEHSDCDEHSKSDLPRIVTDLVPLLAACFIAALNPAPTKCLLLPTIRD